MHPAQYTYEEIYMSILASVGNNFSELWEKQNQLDKLLVKINLSGEEVSKIDRLKNDISSLLIEILSTQSNEVLSTSFYMQINAIEQEIYNVLDVREKELAKLKTYKTTLYQVAKKVISVIYSIDILENSTHISLNIEKRLLDIKNCIKTVETNKKKICAVNFLRTKINLYKEEMTKLVDILRSYELKQEIPFDKKQDIYKIFSRISIVSYIDKNHTKVFNEEESKEDGTIYAHEYIEWFESIYRDMCASVGLPLKSYYAEITEMLQTPYTTMQYIHDYIDFISRKYVSEIKLYCDKLNDEVLHFQEEMNKQLGYCCTYDGATDLVALLDEVQNQKILPSYLEFSEYKEQIESMLFDLDITFHDDIDVSYVIDDLQEMIRKLFDPEKYLDIYMFNDKYKNIQIAQYRQFYIDLLEEAKISLIGRYVDRIEDIVGNSTAREYTTTELMKKIETAEQDITVLKEALAYIAEHYRDFSESNLRLYIQSIQSRYKIENLYDNVLMNQTKLLYQLKSKLVMKKEIKYLYEFVSKQDIKIALKDEILSRILKQNETLANEISTKLYQ